MCAWNFDDGSSSDGGKPVINDDEFTMWLACDRSSGDGCTRAQATATSMQQVLMY